MNERIFWFDAFYWYCNVWVVSSESESEDEEEVAMMMKMSLQSKEETDLVRQMNEEEGIGLVIAKVFKNEEIQEEQWKVVE